MLHIQPTKFTHFREQGVTLVELILVIVLLGILFPILSYLLVNMYHDSIYLNDKVKQSSETAQALSYIEEGVRGSNAFETTIGSTFSDFYGPNNAGNSGAQAWSYKGTSASNRVLITQNYSTTTNAMNSGRKPVFTNGPDFDCSTQIYYQPQLNYTTIYFVKDGTLYKRLLTDKTTALCPGSDNVPQQKQTCPPYIASPDTSCQAYDEILTTNVTNFSVNYFQVSIDGTSTQIDPTYASTDPTVLSAADYANVTITTSTRGGAVTNTLTQRMTKVNQ